MMVSQPPKRLQLIEPQDVPRLKTIFAHNKSHHHSLQAWMTDHRPAWHIEVKTRPAAARGFTPIEKRWVVERTNAWHGRYRRHSQDDDRKPESSAAMLYLSHIHRMLRRLLHTFDRHFITETLRRSL